MRDVPYIWIFLTVVTVLDSVGLFYLWRRRSSAVAGHDNVPLTPLDRLRMTKAERRRKDRRQAGRAASA
jgi:hypothetical protein